MSALQPVDAAPTQTPPDEPALALQTLNNLADALVAAAEAHADLGQHGQAATLYREAMQAYNRACSLSSSENGDDLPGLLHNWGSGLHSAATHVQVRVCLAGSRMQANPCLLHRCTMQLCCAASHVQVRLAMAGSQGQATSYKQSTCRVELCSADSPMQIGLLGWLPG